jgi:hypothetical protein
VDGGGDGGPAFLFEREAFAAGDGELIDTGAAAGVLGDPVGLDPAGLFEAVESGVERTLFDLEDFTGAFNDGGEEGVAVEGGATGEDFENEEVERALEGILFCHVYSDSLVLSYLSIRRGREKVPKIFSGV